MEKGLRIFGHPMHSMLVHFPMALLGSSLFWDAIGVIRGESIWWAISFWDIALGVGSALLAACAGALDYAAIEPGSPALRTALRHMAYVLAAVGVYSASLIARAGPSSPNGDQRILWIGLEFGGLILLSIGGWYGGHLVFAHGIGGDADGPDD